jgi:hypothetical protein
MTVTTGDVQDAARLIALGMRPRQIPARDLQYGELVRRYTAEDDFSDLVKAIAGGLGLAVLGVDAASGAVLAAREDAVFEVKIEDYARRTAGSGRGADKVIHGLAHLAIAALTFPRPDDLGSDTYVGRVSIEQVDAVVREACQKLDERAALAEQNNDPLDSAPDLERAWRAYLRRPAAGTGRDGRLAPDSTRGMISKAVRFLAEQGFLALVSPEGGGTYRSTPRYRLQVRELAADAAFRELLDLGVITVADPSGSLHVLDGEYL